MSTMISRRTLLTAATGVAAATVLTPSMARAVDSGRGLRITSSVRVSSRIWDFRFQTPAMTLFEPSIRVLLPDGYDANSTKRYPVLLLLHGGHGELGQSGNFKDWTERGGDAISATAGSDVIVLMPDGGNGGFYTNWRFPAFATVNWSDFHLNQLLNWMDDNFRTFVGLRTKAIAGLSMGGYGALSYAGRQPELFTSVSAYSGPCDSNNPGVSSVIYGAPVADSRQPGAIFGGPPGAGEDIAYKNARNPIALADRYRGLRVYLSSGDGNAGDLVAFASNVNANLTEAVVRTTMDQFHNALNARGIGHQYYPMPGRTHDWSNWNENLSRDLPGILASLPQ